MASLASVLFSAKMKKPAKANKESEIERRVAHCYSTWGKTYFKEYYRSSEAYPPVHLKIVKDELRRHGAQNVLDAGCGPASMLRELRQFRTRRFGFDLTPGMVDEAKRVLSKQGVPPRHIWMGSVLDPRSYRAPKNGAQHKFASALCFGVLPHIAEAMDKKVFSLLRQNVIRGGLVLVEARNELFSIFTCNRYSFRFLEERLIQPNSWAGIFPGIKKNRVSLLRRLQGHYRMDLPPIRQGKAGEPGYDEVLSRTHNPMIAAQQFAQAGFQKVEVLFYHYHCMPPMFERSNPKWFRKQSLRMENPRDWRGHFMASAFILKGIAA